MSTTSLKKAINVSFDAYTATRSILAFLGDVAEIDGEAVLLIKRQLEELQESFAEQECVQAVLKACLAYTEHVSKSKSVTLERIVTAPPTKRVEYTPKTLWISNQVKEPTKQLPTINSHYCNNGFGSCTPFGETEHISEKLFEAMGIKKTDNTIWIPLSEGVKHYWKGEKKEENGITYGKLFSVATPYEIRDWRGELILVTRRFPTGVPTGLYITKSGEISAESPSRGIPLFIEKMPGVTDSSIKVYLQDGVPITFDMKKIKEDQPDPKNPKMKPKRYILIPRSDRSIPLLTSGK